MLPPSTLGNAVAAVELLLETAAAGDARLTLEGDITLYAVGYRFIRSLAYCLDTGVEVRAIVKEVNRAGPLGQEQAWHAESHLFSLAQLHSAARASQLPDRIGSIAKSGDPTPDIALGHGIGFEVKVRGPDHAVSNSKEVVDRVVESLNHANDKVGRDWPRVVACMDFGPLDVQTDKDVSMLLWEAGERAVQGVLEQHRSIPGLVLMTTMIDRDLGMARPRFTSAFMDNHRAKRPLPGKLRKLLSGTFKSRS